MVVDPFAALKSPTNYAFATGVALQSNAAEYIRYRVVDHLADIELAADQEDTDFLRGYRTGLRVAFSLAGGRVDGSEKSWDELVEAHRGTAGQ